MKKRSCIRNISFFSLLLAAWPVNAFAGEPGWQQENGVWHYYQTDGSLLVSDITPDGYLVDANGIWEAKSYPILGVKVKAPDRFCGASQMGDWSSVMEELNLVNQQLQTILKDMRVFHVYGDSIVYCQKSGQKETQLIGLYKDTASDGYQIRISAELGKRDLDLSKASTYDYQIFFFLCAKISSRPEEVADAIYASWQGQNQYGLRRLEPTPVADVQLSYDVEENTGIYLISARHPGAAQAGEGDMGWN